MSERDFKDDSFSISGVLNVLPKEMVVTQSGMGLATLYYCYYTTTLGGLY